MINTSTAPFEVEDGSQQKFDGSSIIVEPVFFELLQKFEITLRVLDSATTNEIGRGYMSVTTTEVDAETGSGSGEYAPWWSALQRAVKTKLAAMTGNASTVFTIV
jgi:hypothetical protein